MLEGRPNYLSNLSVEKSYKINVMQGDSQRAYSQEHTEENLLQWYVG